MIISVASGNLFKGQAYRWRDAGIEEIIYLSVSSY